MGYPAYQSPEQIEAQRQAMERAKKESHDEGLKGHEREISDYKKANEQFPLETNFTAHDIDQLKGMIENANPDGVDGIGKNWKRVHDKLVGEGGGTPSGGSAYGQLKKAVDDVLEHWEGESANQFKAKAEKILQQIANSASHAHTVSQVMTQAADDLRTQRDAISKIEKPSWFGKAWDLVTDSGRDDKYTEADVKSGNIPKDLIAEANEGYIGAEKEEQLKAVAIMENLGRSYVGYKQRLRSAPGVGDGRDDIPPSEPTSPMPTPIPATSGSTAGPSAAGRAKTSTNLDGSSKVPVTTGPRDPGISGGQQVPASQTKVDSLPSGISGSGTSGVPGSGGVSSGTGGGIGAGSSGATAGVPGGGLTAGGGAAARGAAGRSGIGGAGAMGGRGGGAAAGGRGAAGAAGRGALAKAKGGVAGAPKGISGGSPATPGGTGLGRGRGGEGGAAGRGGMLGGGARGTSQRPGDEEREQGSRPDYLVEDEETWTPEDGRSVPKTIE
ncbi:WXG100 family type VII secretion target [Streptomyces sp. WMMB 322]|uniref:WXG100 family type VII secretion target n=1 Tax=Streptomyces sp. WMMB 322 TaxID=1286821 RepID=UPI000823B3D0|nr:hypothetical protein [Streptomyces sp. WMMB 322]SCK33088.1 hypothetical protein H180DRAFT_02669 [Streptomyces sp. WMMB 322]